MKNRAIALLLMLVLTLGIPCAKAEDTLQATFDAATEAFSNGDYESASKLLTDTMVLAPQELIVRVYRAMSYEHLGDHASAIADYSVAYALTLNASYLAYRIPLLQAMDLYGQAAADAQRVIEAGAAGENHYAIAIHALGMMGYQAEAFEILEKGFAAYPDSFSLISARGTLRYQLGDFEAALNDYQALLNAGIEQSAIYYNIAEAAYLLGQDEAAKAAAEKSVAMGGLNSTKETAKENYDGLLKNVARPSAMEEAALLSAALKEGQRLIDTGEPVNAIDYLLGISNTLPNHAALYALCAEGCDALGDRQYKNTFNALALSIENDSLDYFEKIATGYEALGGYDDYAVMRGILVYFNSENAAMHNNFAFALRLADRPEQALDEYNRAIELDDATGYYYGGRADLLLQMQRYEEAEKDYARCLELDPDDSMAQASLEICRALLGKESSVDPAAFSDEMKNP